MHYGVKLSVTNLKTASLHGETLLARAFGIIYLLSRVIPYTKIQNHL